MLHRSGTTVGEEPSVNDRLNAILTTLRRHVLGRYFMVAGPLVRGDSRHIRLDVVADLRGEDYRPGLVPNYETLLALAHPFFGNPDLVQPYLMFRDTLLSRCKRGNYWVELPNPQILRDSLVAEMQPLKAVLPLPA